jgi:hypothetical protein
MADFDGKRLVMEPRLKPKYKLAKLLELWDELSPEGQEII